MLTFLQSLNIFLYRSLLVQIEIVLLMRKSRGGAGAAVAANQCILSSGNP